MKKTYEVELKHYPEEAPKHDDIIMLFEHCYPRFGLDMLYRVSYLSKKSGSKGKYNEDFFELKKHGLNAPHHKNSGNSEFFYAIISDIHVEFHCKELFDAEISPLKALARSLIEKKNNPETA